MFGPRNISSCTVHVLFVVSLHLDRKQSAISTFQYELQRLRDEKARAEAKLKQLEEERVKEQELIAKESEEKAKVSCSSVLYLYCIMELYVCPFLLLKFVYPPRMRTNLGRK